MLPQREPGWKWSNNVKPIAGTDSCQVSHLGYCISGGMKIYADDGTEAEIGPGDVFAIHPGHDAEVTGDEPCVALDFGCSATTPSAASKTFRGEKARGRWVTGLLSLLVHGGKRVLSLRADAPAD
jgi:hypothetical protein